MSSGHHTQTRHHPIEDKEQEQLDRLMADPVFVRAVQAYSKEDDQHDVEYLGGSEEDGQTVDFDRHFVAAIEAGQVKLNDKPFDPRPFLRVHESVEGAILRRQFKPETWIFPMSPQGSPDYTPAHRIAEIAERHAVEHALGPDAWKPYSDALVPFIREDEHEKIQYPPPHILRQPYLGANQSPNSPDYAKMFGGDQKGDDMAKLTAAGRKQIPSSNFALPGRRYPIEDPSHARNALSRASANASPAEQATIKRKVHAKYPDINVGGQYGARMPQGGVPATDFGGGAAGTSTGQDGTGTGNAPAFPARSHSLAMASATHLANMGHITPAHKTQIHNHARAQLAQTKASNAVPYGALSPTPALPTPGTGPDRKFEAPKARARPASLGMTSGPIRSSSRPFR